MRFAIVLGLLGCLFFNANSKPRAPFATREVNSIHEWMHKVKIDPVLNAKYGGCTERESIMMQLPGSSEWVISACGHLIRTSNGSEVSWPSAK